jgi:hypothetical protein
MFTDKINMKNCRWCKNLRCEQDGIPPESRYFWYECKYGRHNINGFPFKSTKCKKFNKREKYVKESINWDGLSIFNMY